MHNEERVQTCREQVESKLEVLPEATGAQTVPTTPRLEAATPAQPTPGIVPPAASTAMSAPPSVQAMQMHPSAIARKWGHVLGGTEELDTPLTEDTQVCRSISFILSSQRGVLDGCCTPPECAL